MANGIYYPSSLGVFTLLPKGLRVLQKLIKLIDQEMEAIGAEKIQMPSLVPRRLWEKTGMHLLYLGRVIVDGSFMCKFVLGMEKNPFANFGSVK